MTDDTNARKDERINDILLGPLERPALLWLCQHMPRWVNPDLLTLVGILAGLLVGVSYALTVYDRNFLWLASLGFVLQWFGDSLDGNLARFRKIERPKYGYFVDHIVDAFSTTAICVGIGLSAYVGFVWAMLDLVAYLLMSILTYIQTNVTGVFKISYGKFGPTEMRVLIIVVNVFFYVGTNPEVDLSFVHMKLYDLVAAVVALLIFLYFLFFSAKQTIVLARLEPPRRP
jgi:phosphatidylglycerophosphate synthase